MYRASDTNLKRAVAVKGLPESRQRIEIGLRGFSVKRSSGITDRPEHRPPFMGWRSAGVSGLVMELIEGPSSQTASPAVRRPQA